MFQSESIGKLALALSKAQGELNGATKDSDNSFFKSKYADLYQCIASSKTALTKNELCVIQTTKDSEKGVTIITTLAHSSGEWIRGELTMNPKKDDDQGRGSSLTYGRRYAYAAIIGLAQKDDDTNGSSGLTGDGGEEQPKEDTTTLDKWLKYVDGFTDKNIDLFTVACDEYINNAIKSLPDNQSKKLEISKKEMIKYLQEKKQ